MAMPTDTFATYQAVGNREDLSDMIYRIDPTDTPFTSGIDKVATHAVNHEWQTQALATAAATNYQLEGDDAAADVATPTVRKGNLHQISRKVAMVAGTQQAVDHAGRDDEMAYQEMLKGLELKRDVERYLLTNNKKVTGDTTTARRTGAVMSWIKTNNSSGATGSAPGTSDGGTSRTDGTTRAFTEALLKTVLASAYNNGGKPDVIMVNSFNKQQFSTFTGRASPIEETSSKKIVASVDAYESDFGRLKVVPNRLQRSAVYSDTVSEAFVFEMDKWALGHLPGRKLKSIVLSTTGDSIKREVLTEFVLEARNEKASGIVADLTVA